jgi:hypothetical protein
MPDLTKIHKREACNGLLYTDEIMKKRGYEYWNGHLVPKFVVEE